MAVKQNAWWLPLVLAALSLLVSGFVGYNRNDKDLAQRVTAVEAHQEDSKERLGRIEAKVDSLTTAVMATLTSKAAK